MSKNKELQFPLLMVWPDSAYIGPVSIGQRSAKITEITTIQSLAEKYGVYKNARFYKLKEISTERIVDAVVKYGEEVAARKREEEDESMLRIEYEKVKEIYTRLRDILEPNAKEDSSGPDLYPQSPGPDFYETFDDDQF